VGEAMTKKRWWLVIGAGVVAAAAAAAALSVALTGGGAKGPPSHADYGRLWGGTHVGEPKDAVLARWPKVPYQHYKDNLKDDCYEWSDEPVYLYNLCFKDGVLRSKTLF
jgi:hypothetical protein